MNKMQCAASGCGRVFNCTEQLKRIVKASPDGVLTDMSLRVRCPHCGSIQVLPNLRGGDWFDHSPYLAVQQALLEWLDDTIDRGLNVAVVEVGVGGNTPIVTRIPAAAFASAVAASGGRAAYLRVNPDERDLRRYAHLPSGDNVQLFSVSDGWRALEPIVGEAVSVRNSRGVDRDPAAQPFVRGGDNTLVASAVLQSANNELVEEHRKRYTDILVSLRTPR
jgi:hypothetical protein